MSAAGQLTVVIPTRDRWPVLRRTLAALGTQSVQGFQVVVSVDGEDQAVPPDLGPVRVVTGRAGGSAVARNRGIEAVDTPLTMLLDDDMIPVPTMVERHLARHAAEPDPLVATLGQAVWHPDLRPSPTSRWLDWSGLMFDYAALEGWAGRDVGWGRFYSCNVSLKTELLRRVGGFDESFIHYYEDTDLAKRLGEEGMVLRYEPDALTQHLQGFDWADVRRRFDRVAIGERLMVRKHPDFDPWFLPRMRAALDGPAPLPVWPHLADVLPSSTGRLRRAARSRAHRHRLRSLAPSYLASYRRAEVLAELMDHLGDRYDPMLLVHSEAELEREEAEHPSEDAFYRASEVYPYDLAAFEVSPTKEPYHRLLLRHLGPGARVLDHGCGIGSDGLALADAGCQPAFADFDNPSTRFLRYRLERRGIEADVYDIDRDVPGGFDAVVSYDVIEHLDDPFGYLERLETLGRIVSVNLLEPDPHDTHLHKPLPVADLLDHVASRGLLEYRRCHGRSHVVVYEPGAASPRRGRWRLAAGRARTRPSPLARLRSTA